MSLWMTRHRRMATIRRARRYLLSTALKTNHPEKKFHDSSSKTECSSWFSSTVGGGGVFIMSSRHLAPRFLKGCTKYLSDQVVGPLSQECAYSYSSFCGKSRHVPPPAAFIGSVLATSFYFQN